MEKADLLKLYEVSVDEEHRWTSSHQNRVAFYSGLVTAILAGIGAGLSQATQWYHFVALGVGAIVLTIISRNAKEGTFREYQRLLLAITTRAKIEQELGLTKQPADNTAIDGDGRYWPNEGIISPHHLESRGEHDTSELFIQEYERKGYQKVTEQLFYRFQLLGILIAILLFASAAWKFWMGIA